MTKLQELVSLITKKNIFIQTHNYPDQDAIASAFGLQYLLSVMGVKAVICYQGQIDKNNTLKMLSLLQIQIYEGKEISIKEGDEIILVDGQKGNINMQDGIGKEIACVDHHPMQELNDYLFYDIRGNTGACSTIIAEYFLENNIEVPKDIATALCYGIKIDTANLTRSMTEGDINMFCYLYKRADIALLKTFDNNSLQREDLIAYRDAISNLQLYGRLGISKIKDDCSEAIIGSISDFLLTLDEIDCTLVYSYRVGGLKFSLRSESNTVDAGKIIKEALKGYGDGGGHSTMAAGFLPNLSNEQEIKDMAFFVEQRVIELVNKA